MTKENTKGTEIKQQDIPLAIRDGLPQLYAVSAKLSVIHAAAAGMDHVRYGEDELEAFKHIAGTTIETAVQDLNVVIEGMGKEFVGWDE